MALEYWDGGPIGFGGAVGVPVSMQLQNGNVLVVWAGINQAGLQYAIYDPLAVQQSAGNLSPSVTAQQYVYDLIPTADGGFDILYRNVGNDEASYYSLYLQHFSPALVGSTPVLVQGDMATATNQPAGAVALPGGGWAVAYTSWNNKVYPDYDYGNIALRLVAADGTVGDEISVNTTTAGRQLAARVATNGQNLFVTWWDEATQDVRGQMLTLGGAKIGGEFLVPSTAVGEAGWPQVEAFPNGNYIVVWNAVNADGADSSGGSARARLFDPGGTPLGNEFVLNSQTAGNQGSPNVTIMPDGSFFAIWYQDTGTRIGWFNGDGTPKPDSELSAGYFPGSQTSLVTIDDGRFAAFGIDSNLSWMIIDARNGNYDGNENDNQLVARRSGPTTINGFGGNDTFYGNDDADTMFGGEGNDVFRSKMGQDTLTGGPGDDTYYLTPFSHTTQHLTTIVEAANGGTDTIWSWGNYALPANVEIAILYPEAGTTMLVGNSQANTLIGNNGTNTLNGVGGDDILRGEDGSDELNGGDGNDQLLGGNGVDTLIGGMGNDSLDGGSNVDTAIFPYSALLYSIAQTATGVFQLTGPDGTDTLSNIEYLEFTDVIIRPLPGSGTAVDFNAPASTWMGSIRDFDGNNLGAASSWRLIGSADVDGDGDLDRILVNREIGRFAEVATGPDGLVFFSDYSWAGETRVVGIYIDPEVVADPSKAGGPFDSQRRFQNDLFIDNIAGVLGAGDYDRDGLQEVYFKLTDGTAYLHAYMHADGNIRYANYQSQQQVIDFLTANGWASSTWAGWFPSGAEAPKAAGFEADSFGFDEIELNSLSSIYADDGMARWAEDHFAAQPLV